eukprot:4315080-Amphidinium_carterae.2
MSSSISDHLSLSFASPDTTQDFYSFNREFRLSSLQADLKLVLIPVGRMVGCFVHFAHAPGVHRHVASEMFEFLACGGPLFPIHAMSQGQDILGHVGLLLRANLAAVHVTRVHILPDQKTCET